MSAPRPRRGYLVGGLILIVIAIWLLLEAAGVDLPPLGKLWPAFLLLGGLASVADFFIGSRDPHSLGRGVAGIGFGILLLLFTHRKLLWRDGDVWLPAVALIVGLGVLATWLGGKRTQSRLIVGLIFSGLGLAGLVGQFDLLQRLLPSPLVVWGVLLLILGVFLVWQNFRRSPD